MSYDAFVFDPREPLDASSAAACARLLDEDGRVADALQEGQRVPRFVDALLALHPNLSEDQADASPFAATVRVTHRAGLWLNVAGWAVASVCRDVVRLALQHGLGVYDPQGGVTYNPARVIRTPSTASIQSPLLWGPAPAEGPLLREAVARISKEGLNAYLILERPDGSFIQALQEKRREFRLEHRLANGGEHFELADRTDAATVEAAVTSWAADGSEWLELPWSVLELG